MAISLLKDEFEDQCDGNIFAEGFSKYHCKNCYNGTKIFSYFACQTDIFQDPQNLIKKTENFNQPNENFMSELFNLIKDHKYCKNDAINQLKDVDQTTIGAIKEVLRARLVSIASGLLNSQHSKFEDHLDEDKTLWKQFDNSKIYEFITGEKDTLPEFQYNWIEPCQLAVHLPPGALIARPKALQAPPDQSKTSGSYSTSAASSTTSTTSSTCSTRRGSTGSTTTSSGPTTSSRTKRTTTTGSARSPATPGH
jgi:hypothetical protein